MLVLGKIPLFQAWHALHEHQFSRPIHGPLQFASRKPKKSSIEFKQVPKTPMQMLPAPANNTTHELVVHTPPCNTLYNHVNANDFNAHMKGVGFEQWHNAHEGNGDSQSALRSSVARVNMI